MSAHHLADLIRRIQPATFSEVAHGQGQRIVYAQRVARAYLPGRFGVFKRAGDDQQYFVKRWLVPKEVCDWTFHWSQGTSAVSLDFAARFVIQANEVEQARALVAALAESPEPGEALYELISAALHREIAGLLRDCDAQNLSLLDCFVRTSAGVGESQDLNAKVSERVAAELGGTYFRIGLQLKDMPPLQVEIRRQSDTFTLADTSKEHPVETTVLLQFVNYQAYKKSGLLDEAQVAQTMRYSITRAVQQLLFGQKYYAVVQSFKRGEDSIESKLRARVEVDAASIGYRVKALQSHPGIAALRLLNPTRIDLDADEEKYYLSNSTSYERIAIALSVQLKRDFENLHLLVEPDAVDVLEPIKAQVRLVCRDTIRQFDREQFNLYFRTDIDPVLTDNIVARLGSYGLQTTIIHLTQVPTEDAHRFDALRGRTAGFEVDISPQANDGDADGVSISGKVEVIRMSTTHWEQFEGKDFGFRGDSRVTEFWMRQQATARAIAVTATSPLPITDRQALAIELELWEIRDRVVRTLTESLSKVPDLAVSWRTPQESRQLIERAQGLAMQAVEAEFGLVTALRGVQREDTDAEEVARLRRKRQHVLDCGLPQQKVTLEVRAPRLTADAAAEMLKLPGISDRLPRIDELPVTDTDAGQVSG